MPTLPPAHELYCKLERQVHTPAILTHATRPMPTPPIPRVQELDLDMLGAFGDFEAFKEMMLAEKCGTACDSAEGGPLCLVGSPLQVHAEEEEDGVELPDLNLSITSAGSPGRPLPARGT